MTMRNVATPREEGRKFAVPICVMSSARNAAGNAALHAATLGLLHDFGALGLWMELRLLTGTLCCMSGNHSFRVANCDVNGRGAS